MTRLADHLCNALAYLLVAPVFGFCRFIDPEFAAWSNVTDGDA